MGRMRRIQRSRNEMNVVNEMNEMNERNETICHYYIKETFLTTLVPQCSTTAARVWLTYPFTTAVLTK